MPTVAFRVRSTRIKDIELKAGQTIADLKSILHANGYDVEESTKVRVIRHDAIVIGHMDHYVLNDGDCVEIDTHIVGPFNALEALCAREEREAARQAQIDKATKCNCCKGNKEKKASRHIEITRIGNTGIAIRVVED